ncbi:hypothetical protein GW846_04525 [Candidatus Gracilibacteria bacterium]|nr:hypothetical protein [Candidatus Gracilibacteria bacterium]
MKLLLNICITFCTVFIMGLLPVAAVECGYNGNIASSLDGCLSDSNLVNASGDTLIEGNVKNKIVDWTAAIAGLLGLIAVGAIVYGAFLMTLSLGDDERIKKGKDIVKWSILGFLGVVVAGALVRIVVELVFSLTA